MAEDGLGAAVETAIRSALQHLGERVIVPPRPGLCSLELTACIRILGFGEPTREFTSASKLGRCCAGEPEGTLILYFLVRYPQDCGYDTAALMAEAAITVWGEREMGRGLVMAGGYRGWIGTLPSYWLSLVSA